MDRDHAVQEIQDGLGFKQDRSELAISALKQAQDFLERGRSLPWFLIKEDQTFSMTANRTWVDLPNRFLREVPESVRLANALGTVYPPRIDVDEVVTGDFPAAYTIRANRIYVYPAPSEATDLTWEYYQGDVNLNSNVENNWLAYFPYLMIAIAGRIVAGKRRDPDALKVFMAQEQAETARYINELTAREESGVVRVMGGRD